MVDNNDSPSAWEAVWQDLDKYGHYGPDHDTRSCPVCNADHGDDGRDNDQDEGGIDDGSRDY